MNTFNIVDLEKDTYFTDDVILDEYFILSNPMIPLSQNMLSLLEAWDFKSVHSAGSVAAVKRKKEEKKPKEEERPQEAQHLLASIHELRHTLKEKRQSPDFTETMRKEYVQTIYHHYLSYLNQLFIDYTTRKTINREALIAAASDLCEFVKENRRLVLCIQQPGKEWEKDFMVVHSLKSTVYAIVIGIQLHMNAQKLNELAEASLLHEIGMLRIPPQLYLTSRQLTPKEKQQMYTHPIISYNILKEMGFQQIVCQAVLEHHEKENGKGYPRKLDGTAISLYAKIISVACSFEAITAERTYKEAHSSHTAMVEILKNTGNQYDPTVIKALLYTLSIYPIGSYVSLSDGHIAQIVDANPENPKMPVIELMGKTDDTGKRVRLLTSEKGVHIIRVLTKNEAEDIIRTAKQTET